MTGMVSLDALCEQALANPAPDAWTALLTRLADQGESAAAVLDALERLRLRHPDRDDLLDAMDVVAGHCPPHRRLWP